MKFLVCIKQVVDTSKMEVDPETGRLKRNNANSIMNPVDLNALEAALSLRDRIGGTVTVITMGPPQAEAVLRDAVAMGADDIYLVTDRAFGGADTLATSYTLAAAISKIGMPDLIFCGIESIDSNTAQIGPEIAATLGIADVSGASFISFEKEGLHRFFHGVNSFNSVFETSKVIPQLVRLYVMIPMPSIARTCTTSKERGKDKIV